MRIPNSSVLYYPHIDVQDERWLRSAVLIWDSIRTIVPVSLRDPYSNPVARELHDAGVLEPLRVSSDMEEVTSLDDIVLDVLTDPASGVVLYNTGGYPLPDPAKMSVTVQELLDDLLKHYKSEPNQIRSGLENALKCEDRKDRRSGFTDFYMTLLATRLAERLGLGLATESDAADTLAIAVHGRKHVAIYDTDPRLARKFHSPTDTLGPRRYLPSLNLRQASSSIFRFKVSICRQTLR